MKKLTDLRITALLVFAFGIVLSLPTEVPAADFNQERLEAIEQAYKSGILNKEDYEFKKELILQVQERSKPPATKPKTAKNLPPVTEDYKGPSQEFQAEDKSFTTRVPIGWRSQTTVVNYRPAYIFAPPTMGEDKIAVGSGVTTAKTIEELAQHALAWTKQTFPFLKPQGPPSFTKVKGNQSAEISYEGITPQGQPIKAWNGVILKDKFFYSVLAAASTTTADRVEQQSKYIFRQLRPFPIPENLQLAQAIVGRWAYYHNSSSGVASTRSGGFINKQVTFTQDRRFEYIGGVYMDSNLPGGIGGTASGDQTNRGAYTVYGNQLLAKMPDGSQALFGLELLQSGGLKINGAMFLKE